MSKKNFIGRAVRSGLLATAAATLLMGNMAAFAAEDDEVPSGIFRQEDVISGTVTEVGTDSITVRVMAAMEEGGFGTGMPADGMQPGQMNGGPAMGMPNGQGMGMPQDGQTPPELPDGETPPELPDGETPPELPDGQTPPERPEGELPDGQTPPERPEGELPDGQMPPELPEGMGGMMGQPMPLNGQGPQDGETPEGGFGMGMPNGQGMPQGGMGMPSMGAGTSSEITVSINDETAIIKMDAENGTISDITVGSEVMVMLEGDVALSILVMS